MRHVSKGHGIASQGVPPVRSAGASRGMETDSRNSRRRELLAQIIREYLLQLPTLSPGAAFLVRPPRGTARDRGIKKRPAHEDTARSPSRGRPQACRALFGASWTSPARTNVARFIQRRAP